MKCPFCGNKIADTSINCMFCGMKLPGPEQDPAQISAQVPAEMPAAVSKPEETPVDAPVSVQEAPEAPAPEIQSEAPAPRPSYPTAAVYRPAASYVPQPQTASPKTPEYDPPLSVGAYLGIVLLSIVPVIGLIVLLVWACSSRVNENRRNVSIVLLLFKLIVLFFLLGAGLAGLLIGFPYITLPW